MQSLNINQLVISGSVPLSNTSKRIIHHILDMNILEKSSSNNISKLFNHTFTSYPFQSDISNLFDDFFQQSISSDSMKRTIFNYSSFINKDITILLKSALISSDASFRLALDDFKMIYKKKFSQEINQYDKHQNTLLWYLTIAGLYNSIEELYRLALIELNINIKNGQFNQTILHYVVIHGNIDNIRLILNMNIDTNLCDQFGRNALHYVALYGTKHKNDIDITKLLIDYGILPNLEDNIHQTSLHCAIIKQNYELVEYLITLPNINVCIRDKRGYTPLCYLCEHLLNLSDISFEYIFKIINLIIDRCPYDKLSYNFHTIDNENLLLYVYHKFINYSLPLYIKNIFHRLKTIIIGTDQDHYLFVEYLLKFHSGKSVIFALCNTDNVNISNALIQYIAHNSHILLNNNISPTSNLSMIFVLIFYALITNKTLLLNFIPMCKCIIKNNDNMCSLYINNNNLYTSYITFIHNCLQYANFNVFSLKHLCRYYIRHHFKINIIDKIEKCFYLKQKYRDYIKLHEILLIYYKIQNLSFIIYLIKRLYNIHHIDEYNLFENKINDNHELSMNEIDASTNIPSDNDTIQTLSNTSDMTDNEYETRMDYTKSIRQRTIEEIMTESDISLQNLSNDQIEFKHLSQLSIETSIKDLDLSLKTTHTSTSSSLSDDENFIEQYENELADMKTKSKDIEEMIEKFLLK